MKLINVLQKYATGRNVLGLFIITTFMYLLILFYSSPSVTVQTPGAKIFDMSPLGYSYDYAENLLTAIGPEGRDTYIKLQLPIDFVYPGLFALTYSMLLVWLLKKRFDAVSKIFFLALVPVAAGFFDYLENIGIIVMLKSYPVVNPGVVSISSAFSVLKSILTATFYILLVYGLILLFKKKRRRSLP